MTQWVPLLGKAFTARKALILPTVSHSTLENEKMWVLWNATL